MEALYALGWIMCALLNVGKQSEVMGGQKNLDPAQVVIVLVAGFLGPIYTLGACIRQVIIEKWK